MSFNTTKWNKFLIGEAQQAEVDRFLDRLSRIKPSEAPFDNIFKGKWRIAMDYSPKEFEHMRAIDARMEELGHEMEHVPQFQYKTAAELEKPSEKTKQPWGWMVMRKQDKSAFLKRKNMLYTAWIQATDDAEAESGIDSSTASGIVNLTNWVNQNPDNPEAKKYNEALGQYRRHNKRGIRKTKLGKVVAREFKDNREIVDSWNKSARIYQDDPNIFRVAKAAENYSMIISRHPIDVYRMSDHAGITSCHSLDSSHSQCATQEAEDFGMIAYVVETKDLSRIDLDDDEVFYDSDRHGPGSNLIEPLARRRLRRYFNKKDNYDLAIPDTKEYGYADIPGFLNVLVNWSRGVQKDLVYGKDGKLNKPEISDFIRMGGSYPDAPDMELFNRMFQPKEKYRTNPAYKDDERNIVQPSPWMGRSEEEWERAVIFATKYFRSRIPIQSRYLPSKQGVPGVYISLQHFLDAPNDRPELEYHCELFIIMSKEEVTDEGEEAFMGNLAALIVGGDRRLDLEVQDAFNKHLRSLEVESVYIPMTAFRQDAAETFTTRIRFEMDQYRTDPGGYSDFVVDLTRDWSNMLKAEKAVKDGWKKSGVLKTGKEEPEEEVKEQTEPYQREVAAKHKKMKIKLIGKGKGKHTAGSYKKKPSYKRTKSAPPVG